MKTRRMWVCRDRFGTRLSSVKPRWFHDDVDRETIFIATDEFLEWKRNVFGLAIGELRRVTVAVDAEGVIP